VILKNQVLDELTVNIIQKKYSRMVDKRGKQIQDLVNINLQLMERIRFLVARVLDLELAKYRTPKNSSNPELLKHKFHRLTALLQSNFDLKFFQNKDG
jgi:hypothetical protein